MITDKQKELRRKSLGSSDIPALFLKDWYINLFDLWLYKTGRAESKETTAMRAGSILEPVVLDYAQEALGKIRRNQRRIAPDNIPIAANIDAIVKDTKNPVEAKTVGILGPSNQDWGIEGTNQVPYGTILQAHAHMLCTKTELCHVPAMFAGGVFRMYQVERNDGLIDKIVGKAIWFWEKCVQADNPPPDITPSLDIIRRIRREPGKIVNIDDDVLKRWRAAEEVAKAATTQRDVCKAEVLKEMGDGEIAHSEKYGGVTYIEYERKGYTVAPSKYRVMRYLKPENSDKLLTEGIKHE